MYTEIDRHLMEFEGLQVANYDPAEGLGDPATTCPRVSIIWYDETVEPEPLSTTRKVAMIAVLVLTAIGVSVWSAWAILFGLFAIVALMPAPARPEVIVDRDEAWLSLANEPRLSEVQALVIGPWFTEIDEGPEAVVRRIAALADRMPNLRAIFFGDILSYECEISWIELADLTPLLDAYPQLETLVVRGGNSLRFENLRHDNLRKLAVQSGGLWPETVTDLAQADLPSLERLELWLGDPNYGFESTVDELRPLWQPNKFEALQTLALRNCELADEIAGALATEPTAVSRLDRLDLSLGTLTDLGAQALYNNPAVQQLDELDLHYHFMSDDWMAKLQTLPPDVDVSEPQGYVDPEEDVDGYDYRYVAVGE